MIRLIQRTAALLYVTAAGLAAQDPTLALVGGRVLDGFGGPILETGSCSSRGSASWPGRLISPRAWAAIFVGPMAHDQARSVIDEFVVNPSVNSSWRLAVTHRRFTGCIPVSVASVAALASMRHRRIV